MIDILDKNHSFLQYIIIPALRFRYLSLCQNCFSRLQEPVPIIMDYLKETALSILTEGEETVMHIPFDNCSPAVFEKIYTSVSTCTSFITGILASSTLPYCHFLLEVIIGFCKDCSHNGIQHLHYHLLLLINIAFSSSFHLRRLLMNLNSSVISFYKKQSFIIEDITLLIYYYLRLLPSHQNIAIVVNMLSETINSFVSKWKELYKTTDILMNMNVFGSSSSKSAKLLSLYGDNPSHIIYYQPSFMSYRFFQILLYFLYLLTQYSNFRNSNSFVCAADFMAIYVFERYFGIAYLQRFSDKWSGDWKEWIQYPQELPSKNGSILGSSEIPSVLENTYVIVDTIKSSSKTEFYKGTGKSRLVFFMVRDMCNVD